MRKLTKSQKKYQQIRARYQAKRHSKSWKKRKKGRRRTVELQKIRRRKQVRKTPIPLPSPSNFSLIQNTDEVLGYFELARKHLHKEDNVMLDISGVEILTPESVALMVASINDKQFMDESIVTGNAPIKPDLMKLFTGSGYYEHVRTNGKFEKDEASLLHKEKHKKVEPEVARIALQRGLDHVFGSKKVDLGAMYDILIECMSNTKSHADLTSEGSCFWWLYVYNDPNTKISTYTFLDLGVGIFKSATVQGFINKLRKATGFYPNINIVDDLLAGNIKSRAKIDTDIRGKGIPQIVENAKSPIFRSFYIIANDVKINLKTGAREQLQHSLNGTLLYWELEAS
ncbi:MAG: hypothetical protein ABH846_01570 [Patescibacteria group bacterium]